MYCFLFAGKQQVEVSRRGVNCSGCNEEDHAQEPLQTPRRGRRKVAHQPKGHPPHVAAWERRHQQHNQRRKERSRNDAGEQKRATVDGALAAPQKINSGNRSRRAQKCSQRREERGHRGRNPEMRRSDERKDGAERCPARNAEHVRIRQRIAQERLETRSRNGKRRANKNPQENARSEEHTSELQSLAYLVCRLLLEKKKKKT